MPHDQGSKHRNRPESPEPLFRRFESGERVYEEASLGQECYLIEKGEVGLFKSTNEGTALLATKISGDLFGEASLLSRETRTETAQALQPTDTTIILPQNIRATLSRLPAWFLTLFKILLNRLRTTDDHKRSCILADKQRGLVSLMLLLFQKHRYTHANYPALDYDLVVMDAFFVSHLKKKETAALINSLEHRKFIRLVTDPSGKKHICIKDHDALNLYREYLGLRLQHRSFKELDLSSNASSLLDSIADLSQKPGVTNVHRTEIHLSTVMSNLTKQQSTAFGSALHELKKKGLVEVISTDDPIIRLRNDSHSRLVKIQEWMPRFNQQ